MRILDKNTDFYDYLQNIYRDNTVTFDRTDSFILSKDMMCGHLYSHRHLGGKWSFTLLQVGNTFWLFLIEITKTADDDSGKPTDYNIELLWCWKNYSKPRVLTRLDLIHFGSYIYTLMPLDGFYTKFSREEFIKKTQTLVDAIDTNNYEIECAINCHTIRAGNDKKIEKHIPLLIASGFAAHIDPLEIYLSFEEYFSLEKTASERTESIGITDKEKIENHGFDVKASFRGK